MEERITMGVKEVVGLDLGDKYSRLCVVEAKSGEVIEEARITTSPNAVKRRFGSCERQRVAIEVGTHSPWVSRLIEECGHEVIVANPRKVRLISANKRKSDKIDAEFLARLARVDPKLLAPVRHRGKTAQASLSVLRSREALVRARRDLVGHARGICKAMGYRLPAWSPKTFAKKAPAVLPGPLKPAMRPVLAAIRSLTCQIQKLDKQVEVLGTESFPETKILRQVNGIGPVTSLAYLLVLEDPTRFRSSRSVGAYLGLVPARDESGESKPELRISKEGDRFLRSLLVNAAQYILGPFGEDCDLRRYGMKIAASGGKLAKKRAVIAVARKLAVLLHALWRTRATYEPLYSANRAQRAKPAA
jgi:transposase